MWQEFRSVSQEALLCSSSGPEAADKVHFAAAKAPHTHFVCLDSRAEMLEI